MRRLNVMALAATLALGCCGVWAQTEGAPAKPEADPKLADIEKQIIKKWQDIKSVQCHMDMVGEQTATNKMKMDGDMSLVKQDGTAMYRMEGKMEISFSMGDAEQKMNGTYLTVCDGKDAYTLQEMSGMAGMPPMKQCMKMKPDAANQMQDPRKMFDELRKTHKLKVEPEAEVDGEKCWVVSATPNESMPGQPTKQVFCFRQSDGLMAKTESFDESGKVTSTATMTKYKLNEKIDPKTFEFTPPAGVPVQDMTNLPTGDEVESPDEP
ncbi:MAG: hypothetical protein KDA32_08945 [Phycisphaerales bacterium]|nr:hypothetical protein [Phycisphaerales bacterium]